MGLLSVHIDDERLMTVRLDDPGRPVNTLSPQMLDELEQVIASLERGERRAEGVLFTSAKPDVFITGADLFAMRDMDGEQMRRFLERGQSLFDRIARLPMPTAVAINGHCMGGGLELALACTWRVAVDDGSINVGLPEVKLGIIPGWGGATRLGRLIGLRRALPFMLAGRIVPPRKARSLGIVDEVVRPEALLDAARDRLRRSPAPHRPPRLDRLIASAAPLRELVFAMARRATLARTAGHYPAPMKLIDVVRRGCRKGLSAGLEAEREAVLELSGTEACENLMRLFFLRQEAKRAVRRLDGEPAAVRHAAVIGGGTMGGGIAHALVRSGIAVRLVEVDERAASAALRRIRKLLDDDVRSKRLSRLEAEHAMHRLSPATDFTGLKLVDFAVEAAAERMEIKREVFVRLDAATRAEASLATNTSSLSVGELAEAVRDPARVIGLHFFNPVAAMPLVEVVRGPRSGEGALATGAQLAQRLGKVPVIVGDGPGFLVNRVLIPYLAEALTMAAEGAPILTVDRVMKRWGMPMGPFELLDQVGLDVSLDIFRSIAGRLEEPLTAPEGLHETIQRHGWLGRKSGRGFYIYGRRKRGKGRPRVNEELAAALRSPGSRDASAGELDEATIRDRALTPMINEAARLLAAGVVDSTQMIDLATVLGMGLAPFRGGLVRFAETEGLERLVRRMDELAERFGPRLAPIAALRDIAADGQPMQALAAAAAPTTPASDPPPPEANDRGRASSPSATAGA